MPQKCDLASVKISIYISQPVNRDSFVEQLLQDVDGGAEQQYNAKKELRDEQNNCQK